jgi:hypothetical protein
MVVRFVLLHTAVGRTRQHRRSTGTETGGWTGQTAHPSPHRAILGRLQLVPIPSRRRPSPRRVHGLAGAALLIAGCSATATATGPRPDHATVFPREQPAQPSATAAPTSSAAIEKAYRRFWTVADTLADLPPNRWLPELSTVAADPLLTQIYQGLHTQRQAGRRDYGTVMPRPTVVAVQAATATVLDCQDASRSGELDIDTGLPTTVGNARTPLAATLTLGTEGRWRLSQLRYLDSSC